MSQRFDRIEVEIAKLRDYCLSDTHPRGRHKARVFRSRLGLTAGDAELLRRTLLDAAENGQDQLVATDADEYGQRYVLDLSMTTAAGTAVIRSAWIVLVGEEVLRLVSCYVL
ncbi:MAG TPA: hypothetical protein VG269_22820 [Tepidisphaeraceae bacterium]|nr:hypothetical protein [Tepidisphaeraceae bacterium]